ncbi:MULTISPECIES: hypothetical protein [unclassified Spirosoma]|uniref:hypothetical protein n=1 Tax=unclassified Spirosoma TaxID=2621999 RepID=UPI000967825D|nr:MULTISPECIES: hypothetical protein [unclassified Spirosoma]MBN8824457.1 hypothetical protein [Spirosoma sp.]OJW70080.1 MAG: hypothetical protein BGO59_25740 [Spirosoma sp. 48-14]
MFKFDETTAIADILAAQQTVLRIEQARPRIAQDTAQHAVNLVRDRIQLRGQNADGDPMISSSPKRTGRYSERYGKIRQQEGLRTDLINLTFTGELLNSSSWAVLENDIDEFGGGFLNDDMSQRADYLEDYFGPVFIMSGEEQQESTDYFTEQINDLMRV